MNSQKLKFLVIDDHPIVVLGIKLSLQDIYPNLQVTELCNVKEIFKSIESTKFDLIFLDVNIPGIESAILLEQIIQRYPAAKILIYSMTSEDLYAKRFLRLGAMGFLSKEASPKELTRAVEVILAGKNYISENLSQIILRDFQKRRPDNAFESLSQREMEVTRLLVKGVSMQNISEVMNLHTSTVSTYKTRIFNKLNVGNIIDLKELAKIYNLDL